ncbi:MAG: DMT family transporter [Deltaproteobacteria bacterium]|nr:DMT family transporter [Deltaproteobacteria bacterium]
MEKTTLKSDGLLLITATIWGTAFVAQRIGMDYIGPFTYSSIRFALGCLVLFPLILRTRKKETRTGKTIALLNAKALLFSGGIAGLALFSGVSLQQVGLVYTTAGKAGFITGLYVIIVPVLGLLWGHRTTIGTWLGACFAVAGLYLLSITGNLTISLGDMLELIGAFFWAVHVLIIAWLSPKHDSLELAFAQFAVCSILSFIVAIFFEAITLAGIFQAAIPILYGGALSVGVAYTLQVVAQKNAHPAHAAIIMSLETVFAAAAGWIILNETLTSRNLVGCALMLVGMLLSQLWEIYGRYAFKLLTANKSNW